MSDEIEVLGVGAPFWDSILHVSEEFLASLTKAKGGMEAVDFAAFQSIIEKSGAPVIAAPGGSSANVIKTLAHLGHRCALVGRVGADEAGATFTKKMEELHIKSLLIPSSAPTGQAICLVTPDGERTMRDYLGASTEMRPEDLKAEQFSQVKWVHIEGYALLVEGLPERAIELAHAAHAKISFDLANFEIVEKYKNRIARLLSKDLDILFANRREAYALTRLDPERSCEFLKDLCKVAVVSLSRDGCWVGHEHEKMRCLAYPVDPLDSTGAGDIFAAGFLHGYLRNRPLPLCADYGARLAEAVVQVEGTDLPDSTWERLLPLVN